MDADVLATQGTRASTTMIFTVDVESKMQPMQFPCIDNIHVVWLSGQEMLVKSMA